ncbi:hypothetical protein OIU74_027956 [Salix koriyanagi]|uniref:Uncharacterized protein n=1 Tax=Salix koriyanagi TaxID=2511006 RepID=A0A9Q0NIA6_9ROSI|nr:hypothetical protein OIU74_027956 [Salix koriyanagi]
MEPLDWNTKMKIAAGTAMGLHSLHSANPPVIFRDLKTSTMQGQRPSFGERNGEEQ